MSITFRPENLYNNLRNNFRDDSCVQNAILEMLELDVSNGNAGTIFAMLGLPDQSPSEGELGWRALELRLHHIVHAKSEDYVPENPGNYEHSRFLCYQLSLMHIISYCLGAQCKLVWS